MSKILLTGANGLLGQALAEEFSNSSSVLATGVEPEPFFQTENLFYKTLDITDYSACRKVFHEFEPDIVLNSASFTDVDRCEIEKEHCWRVNVKAVENLARLARHHAAMLIHYSTDYIFDGTDGPYAPEAKPQPIGYYGKSKLASENVIHQSGCNFAILRTCVLYGTGKRVKKNFFLWVYENLQAGKNIRVVTDQYNNPTLVSDLAKGTRLAVEHVVKGVFHIAGKEYLNRYDFALKIANAFGLDKYRISPVTSEVLKQNSARPPRGGLKIDLAQSELNYAPHSISEALLNLKMKMERNVPSH